MRVSAWNNGGSSYGISIGRKNRDQFFDPTWDAIEVEIEGRVHLIPITLGFWEDCPEVRSPAFRSWFHKRGVVPWPKGQPPRMELIQVEGNAFKLVP